MNSKDAVEIVRDRIGSEEIEINESEIQLTESGDYALYHASPDSDEVRVIQVVEDEPDDRAFEAVRTLTGDPDYPITKVHFEDRVDHLVFEVEETSWTSEDRDPTRELVDYLISAA